MITCDLTHRVCVKFILNERKHGVDRHGTEFVNKNDRGYSSAQNEKLTDTGRNRATVCYSVMQEVLN